MVRMVLSVAMQGSERIDQGKLRSWQTSSIKTKLTDDPGVEQSLESVGELEIPEPLGPVETERHIVEFLLALAALELNVDILFVILEGGLNVKERSDITIGWAFILRIHVPVGQKTSLNSALNVGDDRLHSGSELEKGKEKKVN